jgi:serine protease AprX
MISIAAWQPAVNPGWQAKVDPYVLGRISQAPAEFLVYLDEQADLSAANLLKTKAARGAYVAQRLQQVAQGSQAGLLAALEARHIEHRSYWVANFIWVRGDLQTLEFLARRPEVTHIYFNPAVRQDLPLPSGPQTPASPLDASATASAVAVEWNLQKVNAPQVWAAGYTGQGVVIAGQDTGYQWDHPALIRQYRGWDGSTADHNYNWHDAIHSGGSPDCPANSKVPCDDYNHGTHTMGIMVGDDGLGNQIGMAPGARWIGCRNMDQNVGSPATYSECFQWFLEPTDLNDENPRLDLAPDIINNSWSCPASEGCNWDSLKTVVENVRQAGILVVAAATNGGCNPQLATIKDPPAIYQAAFTVGATDAGDNIASFSSRGPVTVDGSQRLKPDITAPGYKIRSSYPPDGYAVLSGTSMAAPHVAGLAALLISADPSLRGRVDKLTGIIEASAHPLTNSDRCAGVDATQVPNNTFGYGRIDAWAAYRLELFKPQLYLPLVY